MFRVPFEDVKSENFVFSGMIQQLSNNIRDGSDSETAMIERMVGRATILIIRRQQRWYD